MTNQGFDWFFPEKSTVFGRSRGGFDLTETVWGAGKNSILFLTGFCKEEAFLSRLLLQWRNDLFQQENGDGILGDFDLKLLKNKCTVRIIACINPDSFKINQNGISKNGNFSENTLKSSENSEKNLPFCKNLRGVDLNRNFNSNWIKLRQSNPYRTDIGAFPESEPETAYLTTHLKTNFPRSAVLLRRGNPGIFVPIQATEKERREADFLGDYSGVSVFPAHDTDGTLLQWLTDRGCKALELRIDEIPTRQYPRFRNLLTMCAALT